MSITGKVESKSRQGTGIKVNGNWYNGAKNVLAAVEWKDEVVMEVDGNNVISITKQAQSGGQDSAPKKQYSGKAGGWDDDKRQRVILYQSSRKDSIEVAKAVLEAGVIPLPTKKEDKFDAFMAFVDSLTDKFYKEAESVFVSGELPIRNEGE